MGKHRVQIVGSVGAGSTTPRSSMPTQSFEAIGLCDVNPSGRYLVDEIQEVYRLQA